jgi:hypothetical protein
VMHDTTKSDKTPTSLPDPDSTKRPEKSSRKACHSRVCCL